MLTDGSIASCEFNRKTLGSYGVMKSHCHETGLNLGLSEWVIKLPGGEFVAIDLILHPEIVLMNLNESIAFREEQEYKDEFDDDEYDYEPSEELVYERSLKREIERYLSEGLF